MWSAFDGAKAHKHGKRKNFEVCNKAPPVSGSCPTAPLGKDYGNIETKWQIDHGKLCVTIKDDPAKNCWGQFRENCAVCCGGEWVDKDPGMSHEELASGTCVEEALGAFNGDGNAQVGLWQRFAGASAPGPFNGVEKGYTLDECIRVCKDVATCRGVEFSAKHEGRCWGVFALPAPNFGFPDSNIYKCTDSKWSSYLVHRWGDEPEGGWIQQPRIEWGKWCRADHGAHGETSVCDASRPRCGAKADNGWGTCQHRVPGRRLGEMADLRDVVTQEPASPAVHGEQLVVSGTILV